MTGQRRRRKSISPMERSMVLDVLKGKLEEKIKEKGDGCFMSSHEIMGVIDEEYDELRDSIRKHDGTEAIKAELLDIAVAAIFGYASVTYGNWDWM